METGESLDFSFRADTLRPQMRLPRSFTESIAQAILYPILNAREKERISRLTPEFFDDKLKKNPDLWTFGEKVLCIPLEGSGIHLNQQGQAIAETLEKLGSSAIFRVVTQKLASEPEFQVRILAGVYKTDEETQKAAETDARFYILRGFIRSINDPAGATHNTPELFGQLLAEICLKMPQDKADSLFSEGNQDTITAFAKLKNELKGIYDFEEQKNDLMEILKTAALETQVVSGRPKERDKNKKQSDLVSDANEYLSQLPDTEGNISALPASSTTTKNTGKEAGNISEFGESTTFEELKRKGYRVIAMGIHGIGRDGKHDFVDSGIAAFYKNEEIPFIYPTKKEFGTTIESGMEQFNVSGSGVWDFANLGEFYACQLIDEAKRQPNFNSQKTIFQVSGTSRGAVMSPWVIHRIKKEFPDAKITLVANSGPSKGENQDIPKPLMLGIDMMVAMNESARGFLEKGLKNTLLFQWMAKESFKYILERGKQLFHRQEPRSELKPKIDLGQRMKNYIAQNFQIPENNLTFLLQTQCGHLWRCYRGLNNNYTRILSTIPRDVKVFFAHGINDGIVEQVGYDGEKAVSGARVLYRGNDDAGHAWTRANEWIAAHLILAKQLILTD